MNIYLGVGPLGAATNNFAATFIEAASDDKYARQVQLRDHLGWLFVAQFGVQVTLILLNWLAYANQYHPDSTPAKDDNKKPVKKD